MQRDEAIVNYIKDKDISSIVKMFFSSNYELINLGYNTETELWDYKEKLPNINSKSIEWAELAKDILSFYNTGKGGILIFGVEDTTFKIKGINNLKLDSKIVNDKLRKYIGDKIWIEYFEINNISNTIKIGLMLIPSFSCKLQRFLCNGPEKKNKKCIFITNGSAIRRNDSSIILNPREANELDLDKNSLSFDEYEINEPCFRLLSRDFNEFVLRKDYCQEILKGLNYARAAVVTLTGIGGVGKTALATWAVRNAYKNNRYDYIVSITAKDRELSLHGINSLNQKLLVLDDLLNEISDVIGFPEIKKYDYNKKRAEICNFIKNSNLLLFIDNLETTSDKHIIDFLSDLPDGVKAIVTSRRNVIKISTYPIEIGPLSESEIIQYINSLSNRYKYCYKLSIIEKQRIGKSCDGIALAIKWQISRCKTIEELISQTQLMENQSVDSNQLLEFCFRRVFDKMTKTEKGIVQVLSLLDTAPIEAIINGLDMNEGQIIDTLDDLCQDTIVYKIYDNNLRTYIFKILPLTKNFILSNFMKPSKEREISSRLTNWYEARDIDDDTQRTIVREMRQNNKNMGDAFVTLAKNARYREDYKTCKQLLNTAMERDPKNWHVYHELAEYFRHSNDKSDTKAIQHYKLAIQYSKNENMNSEIAIIYREYGILYSNSGNSDATEESIAHLKIAMNQMPHDGITAKFLSNMYIRKCSWEKVIRILEPFKEFNDRKTQENLFPILLSAYEKKPTKYMGQIVELKRQMEKIGLAICNI